MPGFGLKLERFQGVEGATVFAYWVSDTSSYCVACLEKIVAAVMNASLARADMASVSRVMYVFCTHPAWLA